MSILFIETHLRNSRRQFVYHRNLGAICRRQNNRDSIFGLPGRESKTQKMRKYGMRNMHMLYKISFHTLFRDYVHKSVCQFVYRGSVGAICRIQNSRYLIFSPPAREPAIQKSAQVWNEGCAYVLEQKKCNVQPSSPWRLVSICMSQKSQCYL